jgi:hypothetical protein
MRITRIYMISVFEDSYSRSFQFMSMPGFSNGSIDISQTRVVVVLPISILVGVAAS